MAERMSAFAQYIADRNSAFEEAALYLDKCAQDWNRIRDPGMANHCRKHAKAIRGMKACDGERKVD